jgi:hypothetical protein
MIHKPIMRAMNWVQTLLTDSFKIHFIIVLS